MRILTVFMFAALLAAPASAKEFGHAGIGLMIDYNPPTTNPSSVNDELIFSIPGVAERLLGAGYEDGIGGYAALDYRLFTLVLALVGLGIDATLDQPIGVGGLAFVTAPTTPILGGTVGGQWKLGPVYLGGGIGGELLGFTFKENFFDPVAANGALPGDLSGQFTFSSGPTAEVAASFTGVDDTLFLLRSGLTPSFVWDLGQFAALKSYTELEVAYAIGDGFAVYGLAGLLFVTPLPHEPSNQGINARTPTHVSAPYTLLRVAIGVSFDVFSD